MPAGDECTVGEVLSSDGFRVVHRGWLGTEKIRMTRFTEKYLKADALRRVVNEEAPKMLGVHHQYVSDFRGVVEKDGVVYVLHDHVTSTETTLNEQVEAQGRLNEKTCATLFMQLVAGVLHYHKNGIAHWDIHPQNIVLEKGGDLKLLDIGVGSMKLLASDRILQFVPSQLNCRAPEIFNGRTSLVFTEGRRADTWSCGVILYFILCGYLPFQDTRIQALRQRIDSIDPIYFPPWVSHRARELVMGLLRREPEDRLELFSLPRHPWMRSSCMDSRHKRRRHCVPNIHESLQRLTTRMKTSFVRPTETK